MKYDVAIIGLGPAGIEFAKCALKQNLSVIAFEKSFVGGTCLNLGCIPTKTMLSSAEDFCKSSFIKNQSLNVVNSQHYSEFCKKRDSVVQKLNNAVENDLKKRGLVIIKAKACLSIDSRVAGVVANDTQYCASNVIVASGSVPMDTDLKFNSNTILSSDDLLSLSQLPKNILIVGSGAIGIEWARILNSLGVKVTIVEKAPSLAPSCDKDISSRIERMFKVSKIMYYKGVTVVDYNDSIAFLSNGEQFACDKILIAVGRKKIIPKLVSDFPLEVYQDCTSNVPNLYFIGDINNKKMLAHAAGFQAKALFDKIFNGKEFYMPEIPSVIYGTPEIASIGLNEQDIADLKDYKIYKLPVASLPKAWCDGEIDGFIKIITKDDFIVGAHIVCKEASAMISQLAIALRYGITVEQLKNVIFPHPTYSEGIIEALNYG